MAGEQVEQEFLYEGVRADGENIWLEARVSPLYENGKIVGTLSFEQNVTERKKAEELLKHNEEKYRTLFEANIDGISIFFANPDNSLSNFVEVNDAAANMLGYTRREFLQLSPIDLEDIVDQKIILDRQMKLMKKGFINFVTELNHKDGSKRTVDMTTNAIRFDNRFALMNIVRDITEKKKAEEILVQYSKQLKEAMELGRLSWWELDCISNIVTFDMSTIISFDIEINGTTLFTDFLALVHPDDREPMIQTMSRHMLGETDYFKFEYRINTSYGDYKWLYDVARVTKRDDSGNPLTIAGMVMDISERKRFEQDIIEARDKAEQNDKLKTSFLQNISHEIRTPLNGILGFSALLKESDDIDPEERNEYIDIIISSSIRLLGIIDDVLEMSRLSSGIIKCHNTEFSIDEIIKYFSQVYSSKIQYKNLKFIITATPESKTQTILMDKDKLFQILTNLFNNAIKFTSHGEIEFAISMKNSNLVLAVRDTGIGIIEEYIGNIFDRFWQYEAFSRTTYGGTGLGLSISKELANTIDVEIGVNSQYGSGSTFSIIIPGKYIMNNPDDKPVNETSEKSTIDLSDKSILVVEDEVTNYIYLEKLLDREKAEIFWVENGLDAVEIAKRMDFDLILMDIKLPIMDGIEATRQIKQFKPNMVIVAQTAYTTPEDRTRALKAGCDDFISKPMRKDDLYKILKSALKQ
jgi:PAS domain S-box-containing protein